MSEVQSTIVHLSDLHLTSRDDEPRSEPKLFGKLSGMNAAFDRILQCREVQEADRILVTGDITDSGALEQWQRFWRATEKAGVKERLIIAPGNHDVCNLGLRLPSNREQAKKDFDRLVRGLREGGIQLPRRGYPSYVPINDFVGVFVINSNNLGNAGAFDNAVGHIRHYDLVTFAELLYQHRDVPVKIVALHHSPNIPEPDTDRTKGRVPFTRVQRLLHQIPAEQRHALRLLCVSHRVRLIAHGHLHRDEDRRVNSIRIIGAPATTEAVIINRKGYLRFWRYEIAAKSFRMRYRLVNVALSD